MDRKDWNNAAAGSRIYFSTFPSSAPSPLDPKPFVAYIKQNYQLTGIANNPSGLYNGSEGGYCTRVGDDAAARANSVDMFQKQWKASNMETIQVNYAGNGSAGGALGAAPASTAIPQQPAPVVNSKECAYHATCSPQTPRF